MKKQNTDEQYFWTFKKDEPDERSIPSMLSRAIIKHPTVEGIIWNSTTRFVFRSAVNQIVYAKMCMENKLESLTATDTKICREYGYNFEHLNSTKRHSFKDGTRIQFVHDLGNDKMTIEEKFDALVLNDENISIDEEGNKVCTLIM